MKIGALVLALSLALGLGGTAVAAPGSASELLPLVDAQGVKDGVVEQAQYYYYRRRYRPRYRYVRPYRPYYQPYRYYAPYSYY